MNTTQWKEVISGWVSDNKIKKSNFLMIDCHQCKQVSLVRVSLILKKHEWTCHSCRHPYWRLKTDPDGWKRAMKCQLGLLSVTKGMN